MKGGIRIRIVVSDIGWILYLVEESFLVSSLRFLLLPLLFTSPVKILEGLNDLYDKDRDIVHN